MGLDRFAVVVAAFAAVAGVGCLAAEVDRCADGRVCPLGTRCLDEPPSCVFPDQLTVCVGEPEFASCTVNGVADGTCYGEVCLPGGCGNGVVDPDEACDDGMFDGGPCSADCQSDGSCGNDIVDPGEMCDGDALCRADCTQRLCGDGVPDLDFLEQCDAGTDGNSLAPDACRPTCVLPRCGDGVIDPSLDEVCDDSNLVSGDDCSGDCRSTEVCGNEIPDVAAGEQCDDGVVNGDGCAQSCRPEAPTWSERTWGAPPARYDRAYAYDPIRAQLVGFGGHDQLGDLDHGTQSWDGTVWRDVSPPGSPPARAGHAMAFDGRNVVLFGGYTNNSTLDDMFAWDGQSWGATGGGGPAPGPRNYHAMAYDAGRDRLVLFGGENGTGRVGDLWEWDRTAWTPITPMGDVPSARSGHAMAYDPKRGRIVLFGGSDGAPGNDTWEWNGTGWDDVTPANGSPPARTNAGFAYDPEREELVLFGGRDGTSPLADVWTWNGTDWANETPVLSGPTPRGAPALAYDLARRAMVLHGGSDDVQALVDTWYLSDSWFQLIPPSLLPVPPGTQATAYDAVRGVIVLFTGAQTWEWEGSAWSRHVYPTSGTLKGAGIAFDGDHVVYCGGSKFEFGGVVYRSACYAWRGQWEYVDVAPNYGPGVANHAMAYDEEADEIVMFGGRDQAVLLGGTWRLDETGWTSVATTGPAAREYHAMAYDRARDRVVLFGGKGALERFGDTWEWNGTAWAEVTPAAGSPSARLGTTMVYDSRRERIVLYGGDDGGGRDDTWEWDGAEWTELAPDRTPSPRRGASFARDEARARNILFGGYTDGSTSVSDTWELRHTRRDTIEEQCLSGFDVDGDLAIGCADADCAGWCRRCDDGTCDVGLETFRTCAADCAVVPVCGDLFCDLPEVAATCPGDC